MSVRKGDNACESRGSRRGLQEEAFIGHGRGESNGDAAEESRGGDVREEGCTAGQEES